MGAADEIKPGVLHQPYITAGPGIRHGIPTRRGPGAHWPLQINRFPVNQHTLVRRQLQSTETQGFSARSSTFPSRPTIPSSHGTYWGPQGSTTWEKPEEAGQPVRENLPRPQFRALLSPQHHAAALLIPHSMPHRHFPHCPGIILHFRQNPDLPRAAVTSGV